MMLFDLKSDPAEAHDLASEEPEKFARMIAALEKIKQSWTESREGMDYTW